MTRYDIEERQSGKLIAIFILGLGLLAMLLAPHGARANAESRKFILSVGLYTAAGTVTGLVLSHFVGDKTDLGKWTFEDTALELTFLGVTAVDMGQTLWFRHHGYPEMNPLLGSTPSSSRVVLSIGGVMVGHAIVAYLLPHPYRTIWQTMPISFEIYTVSHNFGMGFKVSFKM